MNNFFQNEKVLGDTDDMYNIDQSKEIEQHLQMIEEQLPSILSDFKKYYIFYNKNPEYPEYHNFFENIKSALNKINSKIFTLSNEIQSKIDNINNKFKELDKLIKKTRDSNKELKRKIYIVDNKANASNELITDYSQMYDIDYLRNWAIVLSTCIVGFVLTKVYSKKHI